MRALALLATLCASTPALAGGYAVSEQSAVAGGTGGASTARADDAGAAWYNPAALADGGGLRLGFGVIAATAQLSASGDGFDADSESQLKTPPSLHASYAIGDLAFGLAAGVPFGSGVRWPSDWAGRHEIIASQITVFRVAPFVAYRLGRIRLAGGVHADFGRLQIERGLDFIDAEGDVAIDLDGTSFGFDLSAYAEVTGEIAVGLSYKSRGSMDLEGAADFDAPDEFSLRAVDQTAATRLDTPDRITAGVAIDRGRWRALADLELTTWSVNDELVIDFERDATGEARQVNDWSTGVAVRGGGELDATPTTTLRGGLLVDVSPARAETLSPSSPDAHRLGATAGLSQALGRGVSLDAFYEYLQLLGRDSANMESLPARYGGSAHLVGLGVRWTP
jgi:long-chain fatty acid transport protein